MIRPGRRVAAIVVAAAVALGAMATSCADDDASIARDAYEERLVDRHRITPAEAGCTADYVFAAYSDAEIDRLYRVGMQGLTPAQWGEFGQSILACTMHDELVDDAGWTGP